MLPASTQAEDAPQTTVPLDDLAQTRAAVIYAKSEAKKWSTIADGLMDQIKERVGTAAQGTIDGRPVVRRMERTVTRLDSKALKADLPPEVLAPYQKTTVEIRYELLED